MAFGTAKSVLFIESWSTIFCTSVATIHVRYIAGNLSYGQRQVMASKQEKVPLSRRLRGLGVSLLVAQTQCELRE